MVSPEDVLRFAVTRFAGRLTGLRPLAAGEWSQAYAGRLEGRAVVIRFGRYAKDFAKDRIMGELAAGRLPVPRVLDVGPTPWGHYAVSERARGVMLDDLDEAAMRAALPRLVDALAALRDVGVPGARGFGLWAPDGAAPHTSWRAFLLSVAEERERTAGWRVELAQAPDAARAFERGLRTLERVAAELPERREIIHADLLNRNVLVRGPALGAILDWGNALYGDCLYDQAWLVFWWPWYPRWRGIDVRRALARERRRAGQEEPDSARRLACYGLHIGLDAITYNAFKRRRQELTRIARRTAAIARCLDAGSP